MHGLNYEATILFSEYIASQALEEKLFNMKESWFQYGELSTLNNKGKIIKKKKKTIRRGKKRGSRQNCDFLQY